MKKTNQLKFMKQVTESVKYAMDRGFTNVEIITEFENETHFNGVFGYVVIENAEDAKVLTDLIKSYQTEEKAEVKTEEQLLMEFAEKNGGVFTIEKKKSFVKSDNGLTEKELAVLTSMYENTLEIGLPVDLEDVKYDTKYSMRTIVGVVSSLNKKGFATSYSDDLDDKDNGREQMLTEEGFKLAEKL